MAAVVDVGLVECEEMLATDAVGQVGHGGERLSREFGKRRGALALRGLGYPFSRPAVGAAERVNIVGCGVVVSRRQPQVESSSEQVAFLVYHIWRDGPVLA